MSPATVDVPRPAGGPPRDYQVTPPTPAGTFGIVALAGYPPLSPPVLPLLCPNRCAALRGAPRLLLVGRGPGRRPDLRAVDAGCPIRDGDAMVSGVGDQEARAAGADPARLTKGGGGAGAIRVPG